MRIYRYEQIDGGGPWFTRDGHLRKNVPVPIKFDDDVLYGCTSLQGLFNYFRAKKDEVSLEDCIIKVYEVPEYDITKILKDDCDQVVFPKTYKPIY